MELSKNDWKLFREQLPGWQERYMDKLTREYVEFLTDDRCQPSERFWTLNKRIREDRRKPGVQLELRKQNVVFDLAHLIADGAVLLDELDGFSEELQNMVRELSQKQVPCFDISGGSRIRLINESS